MMDLSTLKKHSKCKVCQVSEWSMKLFLRFHELAVEERFDYLALSKWLNAEISANNSMPGSEPHELVSKAIIQRHLARHVPFEEIARTRSSTKKIAAAVALQADPGRVTPFTPIVERKLQELAERADAMQVTELSDFHRFHHIIAQLEKRLAQLDERMDTVGLTKETLASYHAFSELVSKLLAESIKLRQQERLLQTALTSTIDCFSINALQGILKGIEKHAVALAPRLKDPSEAALLAAELREVVAQHMTSSARAALDQLKATLKVA